MDFKELFKFQEGTKETTLASGLFVAEKIFYALFKAPYVLWRMSSKELIELSKQARLDIEKIEKPYQYFTFCVRYLFEFALHAAIYLSIVLGPAIAIIAVIKGISAEGSYTFNQFLPDFFGTLVSCYYAPILIRLTIESIEFIKSIIKYCIQYSVAIVKYLLFPFIIIYNFCSYLTNKCKFKASRYEKKLNDMNK